MAKGVAADRGRPKNRRPAALPAANGTLVALTEGSQDCEPAPMGFRVASLDTPVRRMRSLTVDIWQGRFSTYVYLVLNSPLLLRLVRSFVMIAILAGIPIAGNVMVALSTTLTVYLSESAKRTSAASPAATAASTEPLAFIW
jgi:hypothetical protein